MLNLDTHILLFALAGTLTPKEKKLLESDQWGICDIVLWEITKLRQLKRIELNLDDAELREILRSVRVWPISLEICLATLSLDFKSDPADELIAATSIVHHAPLVTRDQRLRKSRVVPMGRA